METKDETIDLEAKDLSEEYLLSGLEKNPELLSTVSAYLKSIKQFEPYDQQKNRELLIDYHVNGNQAARQELIEHNLCFVVWYMKTHKRYATSYEFIDLIQEGNVGLITAIDTYDVTYTTSLSYYASICIRRQINKELSTNDKTIRISENTSALLNKWRKYRRDYYTENSKEPSEEETCEFLDITPKTLKKLHNVEKNMNNPDSLNRELNDGDGSALGDLVEDSNVNGYDNFENLIDDKILYAKLKKRLSPYHYFILYHTVLSPNKMTCPSIAEIFGTSHQDMQQLRERILDKIKHSKILSSSITDDIKSIQNVDIYPIDFKKKVILIYLKDKISNEEYSYLYHIFYKGLDDASYIRKCHVDAEAFKKFQEYMNTTYATIFNINDDLYSEMLKEIKKKYTISQICDLDVSCDIDNSLVVKERLDHYTKDELLKAMVNEYGEITADQKALIDEYFDEDYRYISNMQVNVVESKINLELLNYKKSRTLPLNILYETYQKNKDLFDEDYQTYLEGYIFSSITGKKVPYNRLFSWRFKKTSLRLAQLYYKIDNYFLYELPERVIRQILNKYDYLFTEEELKIAHLHFINSDGNLSIRELIEEFEGEDENYISAKPRLVYHRILSLYLGLYRNFVIKNEDVYMKYIKNPRFRINPINREVCRLRFKKHMDYKTIKDKLGLESTQKVSNIIGKATQLIDMHYYNAANEIIYDEERVNTLLENTNNYTEFDKKIITARFLDNMTPKEICKEYKISERDCMKIIYRFIDAYLTFYADKELTAEDVRNEIFAHPSDCVLNETQKGILSYIYGVKCPYNKKGEILGKEGIKEALGIDENKYSNHRKYGKVFLGAKKAGLYGSELGRLSRDDVIEALNDPNIPLTDAEKLLLRQIKGIGEKTLTLEELADIHGVKRSSIKRRVMMAYISILKYFEGRKERQIDYETDVVPVLKYFPLIEQKELIDIYCNKLDLMAFAKKYNFNKEYARLTIDKIEHRLKYILKYKNARKFDFDYARSVLDKDDLPFYGDYELAKTIYNRYFGDDGELAESRGEIVKKLNVTDEDNLTFVIRSLMIACLMYKDGYRKANTIDLEEIKDYYDNHKDEMPNYLRGYFEMNIRRYNPYAINDLVAYEILKNRGEEVFHLRDLTEIEAIKLIRDNPYNLSAYQLDVIRSAFKIPKRALMSGKKKHKLYKMVASTVLKNTKDGKKLTLQ